MPLDITHLLPLPYHWEEVPPPPPPKANMVLELGIGNFFDIWRKHSIGHWRW